MQCGILLGPERHGPNSPPGGRYYLRQGGGWYIRVITSRFPASAGANPSAMTRFRKYPGYKGSGGMRTDQFLRGTGGLGEESSGRGGLTLAPRLTARRPRVARAAARIRQGPPSPFLRVGMCIGDSSSTQHFLLTGPERQMGKNLGFALLCPVGGHRTVIGQWRRLIWGPKASSEERELYYCWCTSISARTHVAKQAPPLRSKLPGSTIGVWRPRSTFSVRATRTKEYHGVTINDRASPMQREGSQVPGRLMSRPLSDDLPGTRPANGHVLSHSLKSKRRERRQYSLT